MIDYGGENSKEYYERNLPPFLQESIDNVIKGRKRIEANEGYNCFDLDLDELNPSINVAEVSDIISSNCAWYLRKKYLGMERNVVR